MSKKKVASKKSFSSGSLTKDQQAKVRKLLRTKSPANVRLAIRLLESLDATKSDWKDVFSTTILSLLVNTWHTEIWSAVAAGLQTHKSLLKDFGNLAEVRLGQMDYSSRDSVMNSLLTYAEPAMSPVIDRCLRRANLNRLYLDDLTSLSNAAAASLSKFRGPYLYLNGLTNLSDTAAASLRKYDGMLYLNGLTSLSAAAAESLFNQCNTFLNEVFFKDWQNPPSEEEWDEAEYEDDD